MNGDVTNDATHVGHINPFRYRGYYYDTETNLYYLNTRYYDPETGRFMTIDGIEYLDPETINGLNLYAYCNNNPVMNIDPNGDFFITCLLVSIGVGAAIGGTIAGVTAYKNGARGWDLFGAIAGGFLTGAILGAIVGGLIGAAPTIGSLLSSSFSFGGAALAGGGTAVGALTTTQIAVAGLVALAGMRIMFAKLPKHGGPKNGTLSNDNSIGYYDGDGNLTERYDFKGKPHFIKELQEYLLPHTHHYRWRFAEGIWQQIKYWITG